jgi:2-polyprenyl-6-methoxyphenol hydroxylase-like FAD-dependent oxidoreductase
LSFPAEAQIIRHVTRDRVDVVVLGAGLAGLSASLACARSGRRVLLLERDGPGVAGNADRLFECWDRPGIAHFRQPHNFLALGRQVLLDRAPDVLDEILALGAREIRQYELLPAEAREGDQRFVSICARRPLVEYVLRRAVEADDHVRLATSTRVVALLTDRDGSDGPVRVGGVRTDDGSEIRAELVVDALGRTSPLGSWLTVLGGRPMLERRSECGLLYYSRHFRLRDGVEIPRNPFLLGGPRGDIGYLAFAVFVEDNRTFALILSIPPWDRELRALKSEHAYMTAARSLPAVVPWVHPDQSEPITAVLPMGSLQNLHRSLIIGGEPVATGIQPVGDALCHTNPTFAYGAALSIQHGFALADTAGRTDDPRARALAFDDAVGTDTAARFDAVSAEDRDRLRLWRGEPIDVREPGDSIALFLRMTAYPSAAKDAELFRAVARRVNMLDPPDRLERDAALIARARDVARDAGEPPPAGPTRSELLTAISLEPATA